MLNEEKVILKVGTLVKMASLLEKGKKVLNRLWKEREFGCSRVDFA